MSGEEAYSRYTKALDNIKQLKKQGAQDLKVENERLVHLKKDKTRADAVSLGTLPG